MFKNILSAGFLVAILSITSLYGNEKVANVIIKNDHLSTKEILEELSKYADPFCIDKEAPKAAMAEFVQSFAKEWSFFMQLNAQKPENFAQKLLDCYSKDLGDNEIFGKKVSPSTEDVQKLINNAKIMYLKDLIKEIDSGHPNKVGPIVKPDDIILLLQNGEIEKEFAELMFTAIKKAEIYEKLARYIPSIERAIKELTLQNQEIDNQINKLELSIQDGIKEFESSIEEIDGFLKDHLENSINYR